MSKNDVARKELDVHRCRFVDWNPEAVDTLAFDATGTYLAVGRSDSSIEIWNVTNGWHMERVKLSLPHSIS